MTVKTSISLTNEQEAYVRSLVKSGQFASMSSVLQRGLDMLRQDRDAKEAEIQALRSLLTERMNGEFVGLDEGRAEILEMLAIKRAAREKLQG